MQVGRLNGDATWWCELGGRRVLFDPWLVGSEIDGARWFHEAWHTDTVVSPAQAGPFDVAIISQPFADHCHPATIRALSGPPILAAVPGCGLEAHQIPALGAAPLELGSLTMWRITRPWHRPPRYHAILLTDGTHTVLHAPHGLPASLAPALAAFRPDLVAISRATYRLPFFLGGAVNPGHRAATDLLTALGCTRALAIHDEAKRESGVVARLASTHRGPFDEDGIEWIDVPIAPPPSKQG